MNCGNGYVLQKLSSDGVSDGFVLALGDRNTFQPCFFKFPDFPELWRSVMGICLFTGVKWQLATLVLGWVNV